MRGLGAPAGGDGGHYCVLARPVLLFGNSVSRVAVPNCPWLGPWRLGLARGLVPLPKQGITPEGPIRGLVLRAPRHADLLWSVVPVALIEKELFLRQ